MPRNEDAAYDSELENLFDMKTIEYNSFEEAFAAALEFMKQGIKCKGIGLKTLRVWTDGGK